jgi:hypothetical protein
MTGGDGARLSWQSLPADYRAALAGRLAGLWGAPTDEAAFDSLAVDKQQALLLLLRRLLQLDLWSVVRKVTNVYGEGGVGMAFDAWPVVASTLARRPDFTRRFANHRDTTGGFYERGRGAGVLHFLYVDRPEQPRAWAVHFDLHSPVHSLLSALRHLRHEMFGRQTPDWRAIKDALRDTWPF